jgi:hypothetical protein
MGEKRLPHSKLELVHEVDYEHIGWVERGAKSLNKSILWYRNQVMDLRKNVIRH